MNKSECKVRNSQQEAIDPKSYFLNKSDGQFRRSKFDQTIKTLEHHYCTALTLSRNYRPTIVKEIKHVVFANLKIISMTENSINNIQQLTQMIIPNLQSLNLSFNCIYNFKSLRKMHFFSLQSLYLSSNFANELEFLTQMYCLTRIKHLQLRKNTNINTVGPLLKSISYSISPNFLSLQKSSVIPSKAVSFRLLKKAVNNKINVKQSNYRIT